MVVAAARARDRSVQNHLLEERGAIVNFSARDLAPAVDKPIEVGTPAGARRAPDCEFAACIGLPSLKVISMVVGVGRAAARKAAASIGLLGLVVIRMLV